MMRGFRPFDEAALATSMGDMKKLLLILNGPAYGSDETFNAVRLAVALGRRDDAEVRVFLMGDAVSCAVAGQKTPDGYYSLDRMLTGFIRRGG